MYSVCTYILIFQWADLLFLYFFRVQIDAQYEMTVVLICWMETHGLWTCEPEGDIVGFEKNEYLVNEEFVLNKACLC